MTLKENKWFVSIWARGTKTIKILKIHDNTVNFQFDDNMQRFVDFIENIEKTCVIGPFDSYEEIKEDYPEYFI